MAVDSTLFEEVFVEWASLNNDVGSQDTLAAFQMSIAFSLRKCGSRESRRGSIPLLQNGSADSLWSVAFMPACGKIAKEPNVTKRYKTHNIYADRSELVLFHPWNSPVGDERR